ncbi:MAG: hypothetical protein JSV97_08535 [candidate division WOR-3 bacterium]|nr:MAG: hypothetical protein JSV97_08535 [candidate division WOR-3 bacterium]
MEQEILNKFEEKGLDCAFTAAASGTAEVSQNGESIKSQISQMATVIFETIGVIGDIKIDTIEMMGNAKGLIMYLQEKSFVGGLFDRAAKLTRADVWLRIRELKDKLSAAAASMKRSEIIVEATILEKIRAIVRDYLGDFSERIFQNQLKKHNIKPENFFDEDARILIYGLGKAAGMIIGPTKGREMQNKLLALLR